MICKSELACRLKEPLPPFLFPSQNHMALVCQVKQLDFGEEKEHSFAGRLHAAKFKASMRSSGVNRLLQCPFTLPALCSILPSVNSLNEPSGIFFGQDPSFLPELGSACLTPGIVWATVKTSVYHRKAWTTKPLCHLRHALALLLKALPLRLPWNWWMITLREGRHMKNLLQSN